MNEVIIRKAVREDCAAMLDLIKELAEFEKALHEVTLDLAQFTEDGFGTSSVWDAFVAEFNGEIVGISLYYNRYSTWKGKRLYLEDLVVTERMRGKNIGKLLFDATLEYGKSNQYTGMVFQVLNWNEPAITFYKKYDPKFDDEWLNVSIEFDNRI
ncbi:MULTISPECIES: GNAT family N-acetyltransferase [Chryseobacterium]|uniref:GNAT superfamily N-acetyltransferase n=1 Tax=Chryseobacterium camelliae TaxID=1265445 RepID=A0ABU0TJ25_9FLAO|nr:MULTISPECIES: GNAT family N-acetyltransferase [Chryseobacterium]MDT3409094.1 GNAT superfamily N-acetyltransferase [Pseudacidovorax intermedius]MDQ1097048.1 GNAT superfamily N-acetyltransferase [Chryseobacterium camelliae]MDQ1100986.1 GNAT superfamily N-acetyltransferase [Chryseobacterium sp. SORGH_AS_1048]MDR6084428.1 GNAT superfamily N-acetyltransferase [Chryseobacterium sp. SORGH_AS_0909]MDR6132699.1 GNAT superfamily N-acetyltransferase [Chryseobacterium sp. SORGH_AS_1175]